MANNGPDSNTAHFSILMAPAPHLDGKNVIFGEVVSGFDVSMNTRFFCLVCHFTFL
jgi:peptidyl-prolyl isomerase D